MYQPIAPLALNTFLTSGSKLSGIILTRIGGGGGGGSVGGGLGDGEWLTGPGDGEGPGTGDGTGEGTGLGEPVGEGVGLGVGEETGLGIGDGESDGDNAGLEAGLGTGDGLILGDADALGLIDLTLGLTRGLGLTGMLGDGEPNCLIETLGLPVILTDGLVTNPTEGIGVGLAILAASEGLILVATEAGNVTDILGLPVASGVLLATNSH